MPGRTVLKWASELSADLKCMLGTSFLRVLWCRDTAPDVDYVSAMFGPKGLLVCHLCGFAMHWCKAVCTDCLWHKVLCALVKVDSHRHSTQSLTKKDQFILSRFFSATDQGMLVGAL